MTTLMPASSMASPADKSPLEPKRLRVLIVDDSSTMRRLLSRILSSDKRILVAGFASHGDQVMEKIGQLSPDVITLDVNMPGMNGIEVLKLIRQSNITARVIMCSSLTERGASTTLDALIAGASDYVAKPAAGDRAEEPSKSFSQEIIEKVCAVGRVRKSAKDEAFRMRQPTLVTETNTSVERLSVGRSPHFAARRPIVRKGPQGLPEVFVIGSSTGGPSALTEIFARLPKDFPLPILIVQHMPPVFTRLFAERLSRVSQIPVLEAEHGMEVRAGIAMLAPGNFHMQVVRKLHRVEVELTQAEPENSCRPAVDVLFRSIADVYGSASIAAVLTGMGQDGLQGVRTLKVLGSTVMVQDQETSAVWGMPRAVAEAGLADMVLPLDQVVPELMRLV